MFVECTKNRGRTTLFSASFVCMWSCVKAPRCFLSPFISREQLLPDTFNLHEISGERTRPRTPAALDMTIPVYWISCSMFTDKRSFVIVSAFVNSDEVKEESVFSCSRVSSLLKVTFHQRRQGAARSEKRIPSLYCVLLPPRAAPALCAVVDHLHRPVLVSSSLSLLASLSPCRQRSFSGKQFEHQRGRASHSRHKAGTERYWRLPSARLHPDSPRSYSDHYRAFFDHYHSYTKNPLTLSWGLLCFYTTKLLPLWLWHLSPPFCFQSILQGLCVCLCVCVVVSLAQVCAATYGSCSTLLRALNVNEWKWEGDQEGPCALCVHLGGICQAAGVSRLLKISSYLRRWSCRKSRREVAENVLLLREQFGSHVILGLGLVFCFWSKGNTT